MRVIYPDGLTRGIQVMLGILVLALNGGIYAAIITREVRGGSR